MADAWGGSWGSSWGSSWGGGGVPPVVVPPGAGGHHARGRGSRRRIILPDGQHVTVRSARELDELLHRVSREIVERETPPPPVVSEIKVKPVKPPVIDARWQAELDALLAERRALEAAEFAALLLAYRERVAAQMAAEAMRMADEDAAVMMIMAAMA